MGWRAPSKFQRRVVAVVGVVTVGWPFANAQDISGVRLAMRLGSVLGSEEACGLSYDHEAIRFFTDNTKKMTTWPLPTTLVFTRATLRAKAVR